MADPITLPETMAAILNDEAAVAVRDGYGQIQEVRVGAARVSAKDIMAVLSPYVADAFERRQSQRHSSYRRNSLYGIHAKAGLAVVLERDGTWDSKRSFGTESKDYVLIDLRTGKRRTVGYAKVRGQIRTEGHLPAAGVAGAVADYKEITKAAAKAELKLGHRFAIFDAKPLTLADLGVQVVPQAQERIAA